MKLPILIAMVLYMAMVIWIGVIYSKKTKTSEDYFLGGRGLNGWVAALSAQASDMSGWLLMGLPGAIYSFGSGQIWIAVGLFIGTVLNWVCISGRLRKYTIAANNSMTIPAFFENRYRDKKKILLLISSVVIVIFFLVYTASALAAGGKLFNTVFGLDYHIALAIGAAVILCYTFMGGFMAVCVTDFVQGTLMLIGLLVVPLVAYFLLPGNLTDLISQSGVTGGAGAYLNPFMNGDRPYTFIEIFSQLAWGFGYCGMPHVLVRFMAVKNEKELKKSWAIAIVWDLLSLTAAFAIAVIGRAYLLPVILGENGAASSESVFIEMIRKVFTSELALPFIGGLFLCGILAAIMSTADSQLLVTASAVSEDLYHSFIKKDADTEEILKVSRITVIVIAVIVSKVKAQNQGANRNNTTYINGKPVKNNRQQVYGAGQMNRQPQNYSAGQSSRQAQPYRGAQSNRQAQPYRPQPSGRPVQNPWSQTNRGTAQSRPQKNQDILSRAKQNVQENDEDLLKEADRMQHEAARGAADTPVLTPSGKVAMQRVQPVGQQIGAGFDEDCDIMQKLNDLMIMGYSGNLEFDRDFIAEGVDMLNSYQEFGNNL